MDRVAELVADPADQLDTVVGLFDGVAGEVFELPAGPEALGDVADREHDAVHERVVGAVDRGDLDVEPDAVVTLHLDGEHLGLAGVRRQLVAQLQHPFDVVGVHDVDQRVVRPVVVAVPEHLVP